MADDADDGFLSRWARRKAQSRDGAPPPEPAAPPAHPAAPRGPVAAATGAAPAFAPTRATPTPSTATPAAATPDAPPDADTPADAAPPAPTLEDVSALTPASDFTRFVARDVDPGVRNAALKKLFAAPQFNVMDGLDIYIDDYGKPDPLPAGMLRKMAQSAFLNLFTDEDKPAPDVAGTTPIAPAQETETPPDEDPDLRLQPHDAAEPGGAEPGTEPDTGRER